MLDPFCLPQAMASFQIEFFPEIHAQTVNGSMGNDPCERSGGRHRCRLPGRLPHPRPRRPCIADCKYEDFQLQFYNSALFLSAAVIALPAGLAARSFGRKPMMLAAGLMSLLGAGLQAGAHNKAMLYCGRIAVGFGVGTVAIVVPVYIAEASCGCAGAGGPLFVGFSYIFRFFFLVRHAIQPAVN